LIERYLPYWKWVIAMKIYGLLREVWDELTAPGAPFEITTAEIRGQRLRTHANAPASVRDIWLQSAQFAERDYLIYRDERLTYRQAHQKVDSVANWLVATGVAPGDHVAIAMRNYPEWLIAYWATLSIGAVAVGINAWWSGRELVYGLNDCAPKVLICDEERLERTRAHSAEMPSMILVGVRLTRLPDGVVPWSELDSQGGSMPDVKIDPDSDVCIFYTSGTTGNPKGARLTHRSCTNNTMNMAFWGTCVAMVGQRNGTIPIPPADFVPPPPSMLLTTPLFHVTANNGSSYAATVNGGKLVCMYKWDPLEALQIIERERITSFGGVPTMCRELISHPDFHKYDTSTLMAVGGGGAALQPDLVRKIESSVPSARAGTGYGMTETSGIITSNSGDFFIDKPASCGPVMPNFEARIVDSDGNDLSIGSPGELWVRGASVFRGYLNQPQATVETITDGWLHTGDIARMDEHGFVYIVDRVKDMVLRGGENVYCAEVEAALHAHDAVAEVAVFGVPDDRLGEEVGAAVYLHPGKTCSADGLRDLCRERIAAHKVPRYIWMMSEPLPRNASGKFVKRELRDTLSKRPAE
jgi:long-chain acyl-CoA synthetase